MKALSVRAPWWWAILHGKPVENRDWYTSFRGPVWLHAGKWWSARGVDGDLEDIAFMAEKDGLTLPRYGCAAMHASRGHIVGSVEIVDCVKSHPSAFFVGEYGFVLRNPVPLAVPVPLKGESRFLRRSGWPDRRCGMTYRMSKAYRAMIYFAVATFHFYRDSITPLKEGELLEVFGENNAAIIKQVCAEAREYFEYDLSHEQIGAAIKAYVTPSCPIPQEASPR